MQKRLPARDAAKYLGVALPTLYWYARRGLLARYKVGTKLLFMESDLDRFLEGCRIEAEVEAPR